MTDKTEKKEAKPNFFERMRNSIKRWWRETVGELRKVTWPTRQETFRLTKIVLMVLAVMSLALGLLDFLLAQLMVLILA